MIGKLIGFVCVLGAFVVACSGGSANADTYCDKYSKCKGSEKSTCTKNVSQTREAAVKAGCAMQFDDLLFCLANSAECNAGVYVWQDNGGGTLCKKTEQEYTMCAGG